MYSIDRTIWHFCPVFTGQRPSKLGIKLGKLGAQFKLGILASMAPILAAELLKLVEGKPWLRESNFDWYIFKKVKINSGL